MSNVIKFQAPFERLREASNSPEEALYRSIILQAIIDASNISDKSSHKKIEKEAKEWLFGDSPEFLDVCCNANIEPTIVRVQAIKALSLNKQRQASKQPKAQVIYYTRNIKNISNEMNFDVSIINQFNNYMPATTL